MNAEKQEHGVYRAATEAELVAVIATAIEHHGSVRDAVIPILSDINREFGYIPVEALGILRRHINIPEEGLFLADSHLFAIASFYSMFSLQPLGKHVVRYCESAPCHVMGGRTVIQALQENLGLEPGETSADRQWSLLATSCLGICAVGPVIIIDDEIYGNLTPERIPSILARYRD
jgi:NADH:ubiquinone oxidoreductase subunit E